MKNEAIEELDRQIEAALAPLTPRQRKFVLIFGGGNKPKEQALLEAGFAASVARKKMRTIQSNPALDLALALVSKKYALEHGESVAQHRAHLRKLHDACADRGSDTWDPRAAHTIRRTLLELDGLVKGQANGNINISIEVIDPVAAIQVGTTIDHDASDIDPDPAFLQQPALEHQDDD